MFAVTEIIPFAPLANIGKSTESSPEITTKSFLCDINEIALSKLPVASLIA